MHPDFSHNFQCHPLDADSHVCMGSLPIGLIPDDVLLERLFAMRPVERQFVRIRGPLVAIPRRQATYGADYSFAGIVLHAVRTPSILKPFRDWARKEIDHRMNGLLLNWYDGPGEY